MDEIDKVNEIRLRARLLLDSYSAAAWEHAGPLVEKYGIWLMRDPDGTWEARLGLPSKGDYVMREGRTAAEAAILCAEEWSAQNLHTLPGLNQHSKS
jgi:hypothetical protein